MQRTSTIMPINLVISSRIRIGQINFSLCLVFLPYFGSYNKIGKETERRIIRYSFDFSALFQLSLFALMVIKIGLTRYKLMSTVASCAPSDILGPRARIEFEWMRLMQVSKRAKQSQTERTITVSHIDMHKIMKLLKRVNINPWCKQNKWPIGSAETDERTKHKRSSILGMKSLRNFSVSSIKYHLFPLNLYKLKYIYYTRRSSDLQVILI